MTIEEIKNMCIQQGEYTMKTMTLTKKFAGICLFAISISPIFILVCTFSDVDNPPSDVDLFFIFFVIILLLIMAFILYKGKILTQTKNIFLKRKDTITFTKEGIIYNGSKRILPKRLFNLKWKEISSIKIINEEKDIYNPKNWQDYEDLYEDTYYVIRTTSGEKYKIAISYSTYMKWMWLTNHFSGKEIFKEVDYSENHQKGINFVYAAVYAILIVTLLMIIIWGLSISHDTSNVYINFPSSKFVFKDLFLEYWYILIIVAIALYIPITKYLNKGKTISYLSSDTLKNIFYTFIAILIISYFTFDVIKKINQKIVTTPQYQKETIIIKDLYKDYGGRRSFDKYYAIVSFLNKSESNTFEIRLEKDDYEQLYENDILEIKLSKGCFGLIFIDEYKKIEQ